MITVTMMVLSTGVCVFGFTLVKTFGSIPSRPIANRMRVWPYMTTSTTEKIEMTAPRAINVGAHWLPVTSAAMPASTASAPSPSKSSHGRAPIAAAVTRTYRIVTMINEKMMARGRSRLAFLASSPAVDAASNPMKLKNTWPAAALMPATPSGANGAKLPGSKAVKAMAQKNSRMPILMNTMIVFTLADSDAPRSSRNAHARTTTTAGMLNTPPPSPGGLAN